MISFNNSSATAARSALEKANTITGSALTRLASGAKINQPSDDPGGLAVSLKLASAIDRTTAVQTNVANAVSYLQTQDGALQVAGSVLNRVSELATLYSDPTKSAADKVGYQKEFEQLQGALRSIGQETFNGVNLFGPQGGQNQLDVVTSQDGAQSAAISKAVIDAGSLGAVSDAGTTLASLSTQAVTDATGQLATLRASNGASASRLGLANETLEANRVNLIAANSRISDADVAQEASRLAQGNVLREGAAALLAQANTSAKATLKLLGG